MILIQLANVVVCSFFAIDVWRLNNVFTEIYSFFQKMKSVGRIYYEY